MRVSEARCHYDVVVIGGGMVGASFAIELVRQLEKQASAPRSILVIESITPGDTDNQPSFDARSTALSFGSREIYESMGLWASIRETAAAIHGIQVSDQGHFGSTSISREQQGTEALGYVVENRRLGTVLQAAMDDHQALHFLAPGKVEKITPVATGMELELQYVDTTQSVTAALVVLADGGRSPICEQLGIQRKREPYCQHAIISNVAFQFPHNNIAYERFTEQGPLAILPLPDYEQLHRGSLVWTVAEGKQEELLNCDEQEFLQRLNVQFGNRLGRIEKVGQRFSYPLILTEAQEQIRPGLVLLGNVAHTLHPVAGQGLNLALRDSHTLAGLAAQAIQQHKNPGAMETLQAYLERQQADQQRVILFTDQMVNLFSTGKWSKVMARKAGLLGLELLPGLRKEFARQAMGL
jgi:2-octaprenyl-6-methoxyphenol hydroxylase